MSVFLREDSHPQAVATRRNHKQSLFLRLPLEIRILVYEYATKSQDPITPKQVSKYSNKFCWGRHKKIRANDIEERLTYHFPTEEQLTIVQLEQTCYTIARDLEAHNAFYRMNVFRFCEESELRKFLSSITEKKRSSIQHIALKVAPRPYSNLFSDCSFGHAHNSFSQISQTFSSLTSVDVTVDLRAHCLCWPGHHRSCSLSAIAMFGRATIQLQSDPSRERSMLFDLPGAHILFRLSSELYLDSKNPELTLIHKPGSSLYGPDYSLTDDGLRDSLQQQYFIEAYRKFNDALRIRQEKKHDVPETTPASSNGVCTLPWDPVDLPGHLRAGNGPAGDESRDISGRTRSKKHVSVDKSHDRYGILIHRHERYDRADGTLRCAFTITDLRRVGDEVEFFAVFEQGLHERPDSWEELHVAFGKPIRGITELESFYWQLLSHHRTETLSLEKLQNIPSPEEVIKASQGHIGKRWSTLKQLFARKLRALEKAEAEDAKKQEKLDGKFVEKKR